MATKNVKKISKPRKNSIKQKVWNYMRRNKTFRFGDVIAITGVTEKYLRIFLVRLEHVGYVKILEKVKPFSSTYYKFINCTGVTSPTIDKGVLYDYNTKEYIEIKPISSITKILDCMTKDKMSTEQVSRLSGVGISTTKKWFAKFLVLEITKRINPIEKVNDERVHLIDHEKITQLKLDIKSGKFEIKGAWLDESNTVKKSL